jgi:hypothetical protein
MKTFLLALLSVAALIVAGAGNARAFSEVKTAPAVPGTTVSNAPATLGEAPKTAVDDRLPALKMIDPTAGSDKDEGTVLSIPGIGRIGTLPKFDFGLELLYGAPEEPKLDLKGTTIGDDSAPSQKEDDVIIRGTLKHRF